MDILIMIIFFCLYFYFFYGYLKFNKIISLIILEVFLLLHFLHIFLFFLNDYGFLPGKPDQYGYYFYYYEEGRNLLEKYGIWKYILYEIESRNLHNFLYWILYTILGSYSIIIPAQVTMRILNYIALVGTSYFAYKTVYLLSGDRNRSKYSALVIFLSPTFMSFSIYVIRDILMVFLVSAIFYSIVRIYLYPSAFFNYLSFLILIVFIFSFRGQLAFVIFLLLGMLIFIKIFKIKNLKLLFLIAFSIIFLISQISKNIDIGGASIIYNLTNAFTNKDFLLTLLWKFPLYFLGLGFLDPTTEKTFSFPLLIITRISSIDSIFIPFIFTLFIIQGKFKSWIELIYSIILSFFFYFTIYIYAETFFKEGVYGFHFRAFLPYFYMMYVLVLSKINLSIKYKINGKVC